MFLKIAIQFIILLTFVNTKKVTNSINRKMALQVLKLGPSNMVVSSLAVRFALCKLASVAEGETKIELLSSLGFNQDKMVHKCYKNIENIIKILLESDLMMQNKIYLNYSLDINDTFVKDSMKQYGIHVEKVGFNYPSAVVRHINGWFATSMLKRITDVIDISDINNETTMLIVNGLHFRAAFETPFNMKYTEMKNFYMHNTTKKIKIPMMSQSGSYQFLDDARNNIKIIKMYFSSPCYVIFVVPYSNNGLPEFLDKLHKNPDILKHALNRMKFTTLMVYLPKFKIKTYVDWTGFLKEMGLINIFDANSMGLKRILNEYSQDKNMSLNSVKQKVFFELDEKPYRGSVPLLGSMDSFLPNQVDFEADRPFYFAVMLDEANAVYELFNGVYYGPQ